MRDPFPNTTSFPGSIDQFPSCVDVNAANSEAAGLAYTTMWASHFNRLANFINVVQPLLAIGSASTDGSISTVSYAWSFEISMAQLIGTFSYAAYNQGVTPPSNVYPYEFMVTTSNENYTPLTPYGPEYVPLTFITNPSTLDYTFNNFPVMTQVPMVNVTVGRSTGLSTLGTSRWITNAYALQGNNTILIRGVLIDTTTPTIGSSSYPSAGTNFNGGTDYMLYFNILGVK